MTTRQAGATERSLRVLFEGGTIAGLSDAELLERFVARDEITAEPAFAVLVERHGPLVQRVCRSVLRDEHAAADAFQSTFLVLVKKAASLRIRTSLAPWLHAVAYRVACEARSMAARRYRHERRVSEMASHTKGVESRAHEDLELHLHEEIQKLAERHRRPIVLCDLEGLTHEQAARLLGTPVGTIKSRLARGRELLRRRLARHGLGVSSGALAVTLANEAARADVLGAVVDQTARIAMLVAKGSPLLAGTVAPSVGILLQAVLKSMVRSKLQTAVLAIVLTTCIAIAVGFAALGLLDRASPVTAVQPLARDTNRRASMNLVGHRELIRSAAFLPGGRELVSAAAPSSEGKEPGEIRVWDVSAAQTRRTLKLDGDPFAMAVAPDGQTLAVAIARGEVGDRTLSVRVLALPSGATKQEWTLPKGIDIWSLAFAPDGKALAAGAGGLRDGRFFGEIRIWDPSSGKERSALVGHANPVMALAFARDGSTLVSGSGTYGAPVGEVGLWHAASGRLLQTLTEPDEAIVAVAFSPDGKTVAAGGTIWRDGQVFGGSVSLWEVATGKKRITLPAFPSYVHAVSYAPTGAQLATAGIGPNGEGQVILWDTNTWKALKTFTLGPGAQGIAAVKCVAFSPDGKTLAAGGALGTLMLWPVDTGD